MKLKGAILILALLMGGQSLASGKPVLKESYTIKGEHITHVLASSCQGHTFAQFHDWSQGNHLSLRQFESPKYQIKDGEVRDDELLFSVKINDQSQWQAQLRDQKFVGDDPCDVANQYLESREPKKITLWNILIPEARAEKLVNEATTINWLLGALATASLTNGTFLEAVAKKVSLSTSYLMAASFQALMVHKKQVAQINLEKVFSSSPEVLCSRNRVKIYGQDMYIVIKKGYQPYRLGFTNNLSGQALKDEDKVLGEGRLTQALIEIGKKCNHDGDAKALQAQFKSEKASLLANIEKIAGFNREVSSYSSDSESGAGVSTQDFQIARSIKQNKN